MDDKKIVQEMTEKQAKSYASEIRTFDTGANRDTDEGKLDYEGFLSPLVLARYAEYLHEHRTLPDGTTRDGDNWQKGMPLSVYMESVWRHFHAWWAMHRGWFTKSSGNPAAREKQLEDAICAVIFNASGYLHEVLKVKLVDSLGIIEHKLSAEEMDAAGIIAVPLDSNRHC